MLLKNYQRQFLLIKHKTNDGLFCRNEIIEDANEKSLEFNNDYIDREIDKWKKRIYINDVIAVMKNKKRARNK